MMQYEKDLLLKDLCARLPYGVMAKFGDSNPSKITNITQCIDSDSNSWFIESEGESDGMMCEIDNVKPYLFPISSMTEEQYNEMQTISGKDCIEHMEIEKEWRDNSPFTHLPLYQHRVIEFFHKYHFDYRGLIPMGLAIDATGQNIY